MCEKKAIEQEEMICSVLVVNNIVGLVAEQQDLVYFFFSACSCHKQPAGHESGKNGKNMD